MIPKLTRALPGIAIVALLASVPTARGDDDDDDDDEHEEHDHHERSRRERHGTSARPPSGVAPVTSATWKSECASCHMAYPPGLLPARSWSLMFSDLPHHFGDDASLPDAQRAELLAYATANAADVSGYRLSQALSRATEGTVPMRVSRIPAIIAQHDEIPLTWFKGNPDVRSQSNCVACHTRANEGSFREGEIRVPGHPEWED